MLHQFFILATLWCLGVKSDEPSEYIQYIPGTLNVVISAPHGGSERPYSIPSRYAGCYTNGRCVYTHDCGTPSSTYCKVSYKADSNTIDLTLKLRRELKELFGEYPHVIINHLHRSKMDANREKDVAAFGNAIANKAWDDFHASIVQAKDSIDGRGLYFDMHGHTHQNWTELGYMVTKTRLNDDEPLAAYSSVKANAQRLEALGVSFENFLRGCRSLGNYLEENGVRAVPSPGDHSPGYASYFSGGYNIKTHGSRYGGLIDAIQIESSSSQRSDSIRPHHAKALAKAIKSYMDRNY